MITDVGSSDAVALARHNQLDPFLMTNEKSPLSLSDAAALLDLLTTDEAFRAAFQANPAEALKQVSKEAAAASVGCSMPGQLASVEDLLSARQKLTGHLTEKGMFTVPHCFVAGGQ